MKSNFFVTLFVPLQVATLLIMGYSFSHYEFLFVSIGLAVMTIIFFLVAPTKGFGIFVSLVIAIGFFLVADAWIWHWGIRLQISSIEDHFLIAVFLLVTWFESYTLRGMSGALHSATEEVSRLRKLSSPNGILTRNEFIYRLEDLAAGMRRRGEQGFIIIVDLSSLNSYAIKSISAKVGTILIHSVRTKYDIVGNMDDSTFLVCLQNTTMDGCAIVVNRFKSSVSKDLSLIVSENIGVNVVPIVGVNTGSLGESNQYRRSSSTTTGPSLGQIFGR